jgi:hypothetical protein
MLAKEVLKFHFSINKQLLDSGSSYVVDLEQFPVDVVISVTRA